ncbi:hypothetical protein BP5796_02444 [Coleophoma crateriformis]|uniref:Protein kinase domain-containing protein n=1 Tax=Coleophoma crateriformis TaxID=565419 RepID=A0A3D8SYE3_9HELO|nr:hypothetical protein BP5796_02444 [Coleophoma crateriformis]
MATQEVVDCSAINDFHRVLQSLTLKAVCNRQYVQVERLKVWLQSPRSTQTTQVDHLLDSAYRDTYHDAYHDAYHDIKFYPVSSSRLCATGECGLLVFSILLVLDSCKYLDHFLKQGIHDGRLPISMDELRKLLSNNEELATAFYEKQRSFCPAALELEMDRTYTEYVVPIHKRQTITCKGGTADLYQIEVLEEFVGPRLREVVKDSRYDNSKDGLGFRYQFALKSFNETEYEQYIVETDAFRGLREQDKMVRSLGNYSHQNFPSSHNEETRTTYNIVLEFGDLDLDDYFSVRQPPVFDTEVKAFWVDLFGVGWALRGLHNLKTGNDALVQEYHGLVSQYTAVANLANSNSWHADIKPDNILSIHGKFKLADPGFAHFVVKDSNNEVPKAVIRGGTETYGAPEHHSSGSEPVYQSIDLWSFGCVLSMAATWVVLGYQGVCQFDHLRRKAIRELAQGQHRPRVLLEDIRIDLVEAESHDCFHNGHEVLPQVKSWHEYLRSAVRKSDKVTSRVLDLVDQKMLLSSATSRISAVQLCEELSDIARQACDDQDQSSLKLDKTLMESLLDFDHDTPFKAEPPVSYDRKGKSALIHPPLMKTTHRYGLLKSELDPEAPCVDQTVQPSFPDNRYGNLSIAERKRPTSLDYGLRSSPTPQLRILRGITEHSTSNSNQLMDYKRTSFAPTLARPLKPKKRSSKTPPPQNVFQARAEIKRREEGNFLKTTRKDHLLNRYFSKRDLMFLVDNGESMEHYWDEQTFLLETFVMKAAGQDEDGMDLFFTSGTVSVRNEKKFGKFKKAMEHRDAMPKSGVHTDMRRSLGTIFREYLHDLEHKSGVKDLTIIVLTDGKWAGMIEKDQEDSLSNKIANFVRTVGRMTNNLKDRPVSIEFVQFGNDHEASLRLRDLDQGVGSPGEAKVPDVIDTEMSSGDVNKMLLGSFVAEYDNNDEEDDDATAYGGSALQLVESPDRLEDMPSPIRPSMHQGPSPPGQIWNAQQPIFDSHGSPVSRQSVQSLASHQPQLQGRTATGQTQISNEDFQPGRGSRPGGPSRSSGSRGLNLFSRHNSKRE